MRLSDVSADDCKRITTGIPEFDRVLGGGLVPGGLTLVGGDPGIGKSTLLLQALGNLAQNGERVLYVTGEESASQVKMRADRMDVKSENLYLLPHTNLNAIRSARAEVNPTVMVVDSIQTVGIDELESAIGSVSQIRAVTQHLMEVSKKEGVTIFVVGHVTKEGTIAGPKVMEHMVDTVLYFEGERTGPYRILRAHKNRFGSIQEIGVFEMRQEGLHPVSNPSELFLSQRANGPGATVVTSLEGSRPLLLEVQALATHSHLGTPRRTTSGFDPQRVAMLCAVLAARADMDLASLDVYVNVVGGVRLNEPAADLGVALALASSASNHELPTDMVAIGEIGLTGEVRAIARINDRIHEVASLGFNRCIVPQIELDRWRGADPAIPLIGVSTLKQALRIVGEMGIKQAPKPRKTA